MVLSEDGEDTVLRCSVTGYAANAERLRTKLARFVDAAHPVTAPTVAVRKPRGQVKATVASTKLQTQDIREWAKQAGLQVSSRGRISAEIVEKYNAEH